jgi:isoleucyl-tRNA synthetase
MLAEKRIGEFVARLGNGKSDSFQTLMAVSGEQMVGMTVKHPITGAEIPLLPVESLKPTFGTGFHSVCPAHSVDDLRLSYDFNLPREGLINPTTGNLTGVNEGLKPGDDLVQAYYRKHASFFATWKH